MWIARNQQKKVLSFNIKRDFDEYKKLQIHLDKELLWTHGKELIDTLLIIL